MNYSINELIEFCNEIIHKLGECKVSDLTTNQSALEACDWALDRAQLLTNELTDYKNMLLSEIESENLEEWTS